MTNPVERPSGTQSADGRVPSNGAVDAGRVQRVSGQPTGVLEPFSIAGSPVLPLGATVTFDCEIWSTDFRERLRDDDPLREDFSHSPGDGTVALVERLGKLHSAALLVTEIDR